jgi:DNA-binding response OmpR family regulator
MKKVLIAHDIHVLLEPNSAFLNRTDIEVFTATTNDKALRIHLKERVNLIITQLDMPGMPSEEFCYLIREDANLRATSLIMVCDNDPAAIEQSKKCRANAVLLRPVHPIVLMEKAQQLLDIAARKKLRVLLSAHVESQIGDESFFCRSRDISETGMLIETDKSLVENARLSCVFYLPNAKRIQAGGKIIRSVKPAPGDENYQYGIMFTDLLPGVKQELNDFVEKMSHLSRSAAS